MIPMLAAAAEKIPDLRPPLGEIPPSFWEQHATAVIAGSVLGVAFLAGLVLWLLRKKPPVVIPPAVTARKSLEALRGRTETLALATEVSRIIRTYVLAELGRTGQEPTTEELARSVAADKRFTAADAQLLTRFLQDCDVQKFAPAIAPQPDLVTRAFDVVGKFEADATPPAGPPAV